MARNKEQNERMKAEKKELILKEALRQFAAKGLSATKIKDIAEGVGMAQGLLYHYYKSKEEIYIALINDALDKINEAVESLEAMDISAHEKIKAAIERIIETIENSEEFNQTCRFISQAANSTAIPAEAQRLIELKRDIPYHIISKIIEAGQREGTVNEGDPDQLSILFWTSLNGLAIFKASRADKPPMPKPDLLIRLFLKEK